MFKKVREFFGQLFHRSGAGAIRFKLAAKKAAAPGPTPVGPRPTVSYNPPDPAVGRERNVAGGSEKSTVPNAFRWLAAQFVRFFKDTLVKSPLPDLVSAVKAGLDSGSAIALSYVNRMNTIEADFRDAVLLHVHRIAEQNTAIMEAKARVRTALDEHRQELKDLEFRLTGEPRMSVPAVNWFQTLAVAALVFVVITGLETGLTAGILGFYSDLQTAQLMGLAFATVLTVLGTIWGACSKVVSSSKDTEKRNHNFMTRSARTRNEEDARYRELMVWQPESMIRGLYQGARLTYILTALAWFLVRLVAVMNNRSADNTVGLLVAGMVSVLGYVGEMVVAIAAPPYGLEHFRLDRLRKEIGKLEVEKTKLDAKPLMYPEAVNMAIAQFKGAAETAWHELVISPISTLKQGIIDILHIADQLNSFRECLTEEFLLQAGEIFGSIEDRKAEEAGTTGNLRLTLRKDETLEYLNLPGEDRFVTGLRNGPGDLSRLIPSRIPAEPNKLISGLLDEYRREQETEKKEETASAARRVTVVYE